MAESADLRSPSAERYCSPARWSAHTRLTILPGIPTELSLLTFASEFASSFKLAPLLPFRVAHLISALRYQDRLANYCQRIEFSREVDDTPRHPHEPERT